MIFIIIISNQSMVTKQKYYKKTLTVELTKSKLKMCIKTFEKYR